MKRYLAVIVLGAGALYFFATHSPSSVYPRTTYVLYSDDVIVASRNTRDRTLTLVSFSPDVAVEGTHGYGTYSLSSLWRLGEIEKKDGIVLSDSVGEALGIPVDGYIGVPKDSYPSKDDIYAQVKHTFSAANTFGLIFRRFRTNIGILPFLSMVWNMHVFRPERILTYDFLQNPGQVTVQTVLPDGSVLSLLHQQRLDTALAHVFEDEEVRRESVSVAVYNTTDMPSLGNRVGRVLTHLGLSVVTVGNDAREIEVCTLTGNDSAVKTRSARLIVEQFACHIRKEETERADLLLHVGTRESERFLPDQK